MHDPHRSSAPHARQARPPPDASAHHGFLRRALARADGRRVPRLQRPAVGSRGVLHPGGDHPGDRRAVGDVGGGADGVRARRRAHAGRGGSPRSCALLTAAPVGIAHLARDGRVLDANAQFVALAGSGTTTGAAATADWRTRLADPADRAALERSLAEGAPRRDLRWPWHLPDGTARVVRAHLVPAGRSRGRGAGPRGRHRA